MTEIGPMVAAGQRYEQVRPAPGYEERPEIIEVVGQDSMLGWWTVLSNVPGRSPRPMPAATILNKQVYRLMGVPDEVGPSNPPNHREAVWEDIHMQDISAGPMRSREAFDGGYDGAMERCKILLDTCRAIAEGAGIMGDPATYPQYVRMMCRNAIAEFIEPEEEIDPSFIKLDILATEKDHHGTSA